MLIIDRLALLIILCASIALEKKILCVCMYSVSTQCVLCLRHNILCELNNDCVFYLLGFGIGIAGECNFL